MSRHAVILGATGRFGRNAAAAFWSAGWKVTQFQRGKDDLAALVREADVIVNAWNPLYPDWATTVPQLTKTVIDALRGKDATVIIPGNVYVFGGDTPGPWGANTPHLAQNPLGRIRVEMERQYRDAGVRTIVLRGGDFLDTELSGNWFDQIMIKSLGRGRFTYPGNPEIPHAWAYLPDMVRAAVQLAEKRDQLPTFCDVPFAGYTLTGSQIADALARVTGKDVRLHRMSWLPIRIAAPFWPMGRALIEMRYLWNTPHQLDPSTFDRLLPGFEHTVPQAALAAAVKPAGYGVTSTQTNRWRLADNAAS